MPSAPLRPNETASLRALYDLDVLDSEPESEFDALALAAADACGAPIALISLIDSDRVWFKSNVGLGEASQTAREQSFCAHAVLGDALLVVEDAERDGRFADNPAVRWAPHVRFYAASPLRLRGGVRIGTLCVMDYAPRYLSQTARFELMKLASAVVRALQVRSATLKLHAAAAPPCKTEEAGSLIATDLRNSDGAMDPLFVSSPESRPAQSMDRNGAPHALAQSSLQRERASPVRGRFGAKPRGSLPIPLLFSDASVRQRTDHDCTDAYNGAGARHFRQPGTSS